MAMIEAPAELAEVLAEGHRVRRRARLLLTGAKPCNPRRRGHRSVHARLVEREHRVGRQRAGGRRRGHRRNAAELLRVRVPAVRAGAATRPARPPARRCPTRRRFRRRRGSLAGPSSRDSVTAAVDARGGACRRGVGQSGHEPGQVPAHGPGGTGRDLRQVEVRDRGRAPPPRTSPEGWFSSRHAPPSWRAARRQSSGPSTMSAMMRITRILAGSRPPTVADPTWRAGAGTGRGVD